MLIAGFPSGSLQANCYLVATAAGADCVVVDPGQESAERVATTCTEHQLTPVAVLLTHGHFDHVGAAAELCRRFDVPVYIHQEDQPMLADPMAAVSAQFRALMADTVFPPEPAIVVPIAGSGPLDLAGLDLSVLHTPGHTRGSSVYRLGGSEGRPAVLFTGDTLFAGTIGRSDLPGGDGAQLIASIRTELLSCPDDTVVLPGHGPASTIGAERTANPFLA